MTLPRGWVAVKLQELVTFNPKHAAETDKDTQISFVPMPAVDEYSGHITSATDRPLREVWTGYTHFADGDVIFAKITPCMENGKAAVVRGMTSGLACGSTEFFVFRSNGSILPEYLWRYVRQISFRQTAERHMSGAVGQRRVPRDYLEGYDFPLPPLAEQRRIVKKLDALAARITRARTELERVPVLAAMLRHQALQMAFRGSLTHSWEGRGNYSPVAPRLPNEIRSKFHVSSTAEEAHPFPIPETWRWYRLPQIGNLDRGKSRHRPRNDKRLFGGEHPFIQTGDVRAAGQYLKTYTETYSDFGLSQSRKWPCGTVCITIAANIAETTILGIQACFPDSVVGFTPDAERGMPEYFEYFIRTAKADLNQFAPATAQKNINLDTLGAIAVPIPPLEEQREIVRRLGEAFTRADRLEAEAARAKTLLDRLESAILAQAFRGELVPQDPEDEPAETLLTRLRATSTTAPTKRGRRVKEVA